MTEKTLDSGILETKVPTPTPLSTGGLTVPAAKVPNADTAAAIDESRAGGGTQAESAESLIADAAETASKLSRTAVYAKKVVDQECTHIHVLPSDICPDEFTAEMATLNKTVRRHGTSLHIS